MKRITMGALTALMAGALLFAGMGTAWAHRPQLSGTTSCPGADHVITWSIGNDLKKPMTIVSADAVMNGTHYSVDGYTSPVLKDLPTSATSTVPGDLTGTVTLTVVGHWPDGVENPKSVDVALETPCAVTTTTTSTTPSTTAPPGCTANCSPTTTSSLGPPVSDSTPCVSTAVTPCTLAFTDGSTVPTRGATAAAFTLLGLGSVLLLGAGIGLKRRGL